MYTREEILNGLSVDQIKEAIDNYAKSDGKSIEVKPKEYETYGYNVAEFFNHIENANISKEDKLVCFDKLKQATESQLQKHFSLDEIHSPDFVQGYIQDYQKLEDAENKNSLAAKGYHQYANIVRNVEYARYCVFKETTSEGKLADQIVTACLDEGSVKPFEDAKQKNAGQFFDSRWDRDFKQILQDIVVPEGLAGKNMEEYQALLKEFIVDRSGYEQKKNEKLDVYLATQNNLREVKLQQAEKYSHLSEEEKADIARNPALKTPITMQSSVARRPSSTGAMLFVTLQKIDVANKDFRLVQENQHSEKAEQSSLEQRVAALRGLGATAQTSVQKTSLPNQSLKGNQYEG